MITQVIDFFILLLLLFFIVTGTLKGYDQLLNLVLDEAIEFLRGMSILVLFSCFF